MRKRKVGSTVTQWLGVGSAVATLLSAIFKFPPGGIPLFCTVLFAFFVLYCIYDVVSWINYVSVWIINPIAIALAVYWWVAFLARYNIPKKPLFPMWFYPDGAAYLILLAALVIYCAWDMRDAVDPDHNYSDQDAVLTLSSSMIVVLFGLAYYTWA
jgi:hypothetical protein